MPREALQLAAVPRTDGAAVPLHSPEIERSVLAAALIDEAAAAEVAARTRPEHYHDPAHRLLVEAIRTLVTGARPRPVEPATLAEALRDAGAFEAMGGHVYLAQLWDYLPSAVNVTHYVDRLLDLHTRREVLRAGRAIQDHALHEACEAAELVDRAGAEVFALSAGTAAGRDLVVVKSRLYDVVERLEQRAESGRSVTGVPSGFADLDEKTAGFQPGDLVIVAGRPSQGKTAFSVGVAQHVAIRERKPVAVFSLEMSTESLIERMLSSEARIDANHLRTGRLKDDEYARLATAMGLLNVAPIYLDDTPGLSVTAMRTKARRLKAEHPELAMVVVDYLQLMTGEGENRTQVVSEISRGLKALAKELAVPVVALSQLSRAVEQRPDKRPLMSDLRESGQLEQDADLILFLFRPEYYFGSTDKDGNNIEGLAEVIIGKQRNGATGSLTLRFLKEFTRFESFSSRPQP